MAAEIGHWITLEDGRHVFISGAAGHVPARLKSEGDGNRFTKAALEQKLIAHHNETTGGSYTAHNERQLNAAAGTGDPFTFLHKLPTEVKEFMAGRPELRSLFKVTSNSAEAGGADAFGELGDRYLHIAEAKAGSPLKAAKETAHKSNDPEISFLAAVHDNLPKGKFQHDSIQASGLRVGDKFTIGGTPFRVAEDAQGFRVLEGGKDYPETPVDALQNVPIDKGSLRQGKKPRLEAAPFSREGSGPATVFVRGGNVDAEPALMLASDCPYPKQKNGVPCHYLWKEVLKPGKWLDARGVVADVTPQRIDTIYASFQRQKAKNMLPFIPPSHFERGGDRNLGWIVDARKSESGSLELLHQLIGDDARLAASRCGTSLYTLTNLRTQDGETIPEFIDHNALLPDPAIPDLKDFEPALAASRGPAEAAVYLELASDETQDSQRSEQMKLTPEQRRRLETIAPAGSKIPDEPDADFLLNLAETANKATGVALSRATELEGERDKARSEANGLRLSRDTTSRPLDPEVVHVRQQLIGTAIDNLSGKGYSKATIDALKGELIGSDKDPNVLMLSRLSPENLSSPVRAEKIIEILSKNTVPPPTGTQSGIQLSREVQQGDGSDADRKEQEKKWREQGEAAKRAQLESRGLK